jgi:hypothetical protein
MAGFEIVGVVLGVLPLLSSAVGTYDNVYRPFVTQYKNYEPALKSLQLGLLTERAIFRNECRLLLRSSVEPELVKDMLEDLKHDAWTDNDIEQKVSQYLGDSKKECEAAISLIRGKLLEILEEYQRYGIVIDSELLNTDVSPLSDLLPSQQILKPFTNYVVSLVTWIALIGSLNSAGLKDDLICNFKI